jgi:hypothetical protein
MHAESNIRAQRKVLAANMARSLKLDLMVTVSLFCTVLVVGLIGSRSLCPLELDHRKVAV